MDLATLSTNLLSSGVLSVLVTNVLTSILTAVLNSPLGSVLGSVEHVPLAFVSAILVSEKYVTSLSHRCSPLIFGRLRSMSLVGYFCTSGTGLS